MDVLFFLLLCLIGREELELDGERHTYVTREKCISDAPFEKMYLCTCWTCCTCHGIPLNVCVAEGLLRVLCTRALPGQCIYNMWHTMQPALHTRIRILLLLQTFARLCLARQHSKLFNTIMLASCNPLRPMWMYGP